MISFKCQKCGEGMEAPVCLHGETLDCPTCHELVSVPESQEEPLQQESPNALKQPPEQKSESPAQDLIHFECSCGAKVKINRSFAGKTGACPKCSHTVVIPKDSN